MENQKTISVTHINVRQSISFLIIKLTLLEIINALVILFLYFPLSQTNTIFNVIQIPQVFHLGLFIVITIFKMFISFFVIFLWLNDYYEIAPNKIIHRSGFIFKKEEQYAFVHISSIGLKQSLLGKILNYGTLELYDRFDKKHKYLYLIHNPIRHFHIIQSLLPYRDESQQKVRDTLIENEDDRV